MRFGRSLPTSIDAHRTTVSRPVRRRRLTAMVALGVIGALSFASAGWAARSGPGALPPAAPPLEDLPQFATVERRVLSEMLVTRGSIGSAGAIEVKVTAAGDSTPIITGVPVAGDDVGHGAPILEVSGRPLFALVGQVPAYRDLRPGMSGADVEQLQTALVAAGFGPLADTSGWYGPSTAEAIRRLYEDAGYEPPSPAPEAAAQLASASSAVEDAEASIPGLGDPITKLETELALSSAERQLQAAQAEGDEAVAFAEDSLRRAAAERDNRPTAESDEAVAAAERALASAVRSRLLSVAAAQDALMLARARLTSGVGGEAAGDELDKARLELLEAAFKAGTPLPKHEVQYVPSLPTQVVDVASSLGEPPSVEQPAVTLADGRIGVSVQVLPRVAQALRTGMDAVVVDDASGQEFAATVGDAVDAAAPTSGDSVEVFMEFESSVDVDTVSRDVRVTVAIVASDGPVIAVPITAVRSTASGDAFVEYLDDGRQVRASVQIGQVSDGWAEVKAATPPLRKGMQVRVVGPST